MNSNPERVQVYIDGFNLYFGMTTKLKEIKWLNIYALSQKLIKPDQTLIGVKYFTSRVSNHPAKEKRQRTYLDAINTTGTEIIYGHYKSNRTLCNRCGHSWAGNEEKMTDVNIAVHLLTDALEDTYDTALLISGDSDLVPSILAVHSKFPHKRVMVGFPPERHNNSVRNVAKGSFIIGRNSLVNAQFPNVITLVNGFQISRPAEW